MSEGAEPSLLETHTLDTLLAELVSGRPVALAGDGETFSLDSAETRSLFDWYRANRSKWSKNVQKADVEALVDRLRLQPPDVPVARTATSSTGRRVLRLKTVRAHRFAGIHRFGSVGQSPEEFEFQFARPATLIFGSNGAGKTSLLNAIVWCLTGKIYRSQRPPDSGDASLDVFAPRDDGESPDARWQNEIAPITPLPPKDELAAVGSDKLPLDTWVELTFTDEAGNDVGPIRRSLDRSKRGKLTVIPPDLTPLGVDPIALEVGTTMPGLLPFLQLGEQSALGEAVATLTGIQPLQDVARHAAKVQEKLRKDLVKDRRQEISGFDAEYSSVRDEYLELIREHPQLEPEQTVPPVSEDAATEEVISACIDYFEGRQELAFEQAKEILGESFQPNDSEMREELTTNIGPALGCLDHGSLGRLSSAARLGRLGRLTPEEVDAARRLTQEILAEAGELQELATSEQSAQRLRLYARVAEWLKEIPDCPSSIIECPICAADLAGKVDPVTQRPVSEHLEHYLSVETKHLQKTLKAWTEETVARLLKDLPQILSNEINSPTTLPAQPTDLVHAALAEELFEAGVFRGSLAPLQQAARELCASALSELPELATPTDISLPACFGQVGQELVDALTRIERAIAIGEWRHMNTEAISGAYAAIVGSAEQRRTDEDSDDEPVDRWPLRRRMLSLSNMVQQTTPLREALFKLRTMMAKLVERRKQEERIKLYDHAATAIEPLLDLHQLVDRQVTGLVDHLSAETRKWKDRLYTPAVVGAPSISGVALEGRGSLTMAAEAGGTTASAHQVSNASDLRASLLAFVISFRQHIVERRGGLSLILLDDIHELFDPFNRRRVANALPELVQTGARAVVTSNDPTFVECVRRAFRLSGLSSDLAQFHAHPLSGARPRISLGNFSDDIAEKRRAFQENENVDQTARDFANALRIYCEDRLLDLFRASTPSGLPGNPTLADLVGALRSLRRSGQSPFHEQAFGDLVADPAFDLNGSLMTIMNLCHHGTAARVSYGDVNRETNTIERVLRLVKRADDAYERWLRRDPVPPALVAQPAMPVAIDVLQYQRPLFTNLAAFTAQAGPQEITKADEQFCTSALRNLAAYLVRAHNLGMSAPSGARVLVRLSDDQPPDNSLVVALCAGRTHIGRLHCNPNDPSTVVIGSEAPNPLKRPPSTFLPVAETRLLQVAGVVFGEVAYRHPTSADAVALDTCDVLNSIEIAFQVDRDSAVPLALPGQTVLGGASVQPNEIAELVGQPIAISTSDGSVLKRVGQVLPGFPHARLFEALGGEGATIAVRLEALPDDPAGNLPLLDSARKVIGVIYEQRE